YQAAVSSAHRPGAGDAVSRGHGHTPRTAGPALYGSRPPGPGPALLAPGRATCHCALGVCRGVPAPQHRVRGAGDGARDTRAPPARAGPPDGPQPGVASHQGLRGTRARTRPHPGRGAESAVGRTPTAFYGAVRPVVVPCNPGRVPDGAGRGGAAPRPGPT